MTLFWNLMQSVITVLEIRGCVWMMENFAGSRFHGKKQKAAVWIVSIGVGGLYAANRWMGMYYSRLMLLTVFLLLSIASVWLFQCRRGSAVFMAFNYLMISGLLDLLFMSGAEIISGSPELFAHVMEISSGCRFAVMLLSRLSLCLLCLFVYKKTDRDVICQLTGFRIWMACVIICVTEYMGIHILTGILGVYQGTTYDFFPKAVFFLVMILLMLTVVSVTVLYYGQKEQLKQKNMLLESLDYEKQRMFRLYRERETLYHDFKNHLLTLDSWVRSGKFDQYHAYMERISKPFLESVRERRVGHEVIDMMLNYKMSEAEKQQIRIQCEILGYMDFKLDIRDEDLCSLMGNLWDNAIEACQRMPEEERRIDFRIRVRPGKLLMEMTNPCMKIEKNVGGEPVTSKKDRNFHGIGMREIRNIAERYGGYFNYTLKDSTFKVEVMICNE